MLITIIQLSISMAVLLIAAVFDIKTRKIPNVITIPAFFIGVIFSCIFQLSQLPWNAIVVLILFGVSFLRVMGNGDIKLLMAVAMMNDWKTALLTVGFGSLFLFLGYLIRRPKQAVSEASDTVKSMVLFRTITIDKSGKKYPFAPYLGAGYVVAYSLIHFLGVLA